MNNSQLPVYPLLMHCGSLPQPTAGPRWNWLYTLLCTATYSLVQHCFRYPWADAVTDTTSVPTLQGRVDIPVLPYRVSSMAGALQWRHNERDGASNHQPHDCLLNLLFRHRSKKTSKRYASLAFVRGIHRWPVDSLHKRPVTRKVFPSDDVIMGMCRVL